MSEVFFEYFPYYLISCVLSLLMIQWLINDIFIASIAGKYGKAFNKSIDIKSEYSLPQRINQKYIGKYVATEYKRAYSNYMCLKKGVAIYFVVVFLALLCIGEMCEEYKMILVWRVISGINTLIMLFLFLHFDINRQSKYTRHK